MPTSRSGEMLTSAKLAMRAVALERASKAVTAFTIVVVFNACSPREASRCAGPRRASKRERCRPHGEVVLARPASDRRMEDATGTRRDSSSLCASN